MKKIRVLHFYSIMNAGGAETFIMNVYRKIDKNKFHFDFLCSSNKKGFYDEEIKQLGGNIYYYEVHKNPFKTIKNIRKQLKEHGPYDCIHSPLMFYSSIICIAAKLEGVKNIIVHSHSAGDNKRKSFFRKIYIFISRIIINILATKKLACGKIAGEFLYGKNVNFEVLYNGINLEKFNNIKTRTINIANISNLDMKYKGQKYLVRAVDALIKEGYNIDLYFIGGGSGEKLKKLVKKIGVDNHVYFCGFMEHKQIFKFLETIDIYIQPSDAESHGRVIVEAMSMGCPVIGSNVGGIPELVEKKNVFKKKNFYDLKRKIENIIKEIEVGTRKTKGNYECIVDRKEAMKKAISMANKNDIVIIAGKGHEMYQEVQKEQIPFDEREVIKEIIG